MLLLVICMQKYIYIYIYICIYMYTYTHPTYHHRSPCIGNTFENLPTILGNILIHPDSIMPQTPLLTCSLLFVLGEIPIQVTIGAEQLGKTPRNNLVNQICFPVTMALWRDNRIHHSQTDPFNTDLITTINLGKL